MMMDYKNPASSTDDRPYYYVVDRMYNVRFIVDWAGAMVERYAYDPYGRPRIREAAGPGDFDFDAQLVVAFDYARVQDAVSGAIWDARADIDGDGDFDSVDQTRWTTKSHLWPPGAPTNPTVSQAFSDVDNPFGFQGRVHFTLDTNATATEGNLMLVDHRLRMNDPVQGRWLTRDPIGYFDGLSLYEYLRSNALFFVDPFGLTWILGLHSDPGLSGGQDPKDGHSWITLGDTTTGTRTTYGLWPDFHPAIRKQGLANGLGSDVRTNFRGDRDRPPATSIYWEISDEQAKALKEYVRSINWWTGGNNCSRFAGKCVETVVGIRVTAYDGRILFFRTPAALVRWIKREQERREQEALKEKEKSKDKEDEPKDDKNDEKKPPTSKWL